VNTNKMDPNSFRCPNVFAVAGGTKTNTWDDSYHIGFQFTRH